MTRPLTSGDKIAAALARVIVAAPLEEQKELFAAVAAFRSKYSRSYAGVRKQPFAAKLLDAIDDAAEEIAYRQSGADFYGDLDEAADRRVLRPSDYE